MSIQPFPKFRITKVVLMGDRYPTHFLDVTYNNKDWSCLTNGSKDDCLKCQAQYIANYQARQK